MGADHAALVRQSRLRQWRVATPTAAIIDSQSARTALKGQRSYNAVKRHIAVDRDGHLLAAVVYSAGVQDSAGARLLPSSASQPDQV